MASASQWTRRHSKYCASTCSKPAACVPKRAPQPLLPRSRQLFSTSTNSWRTWGPSQSWSDGDAEYFSLTSQLSQQIPGFAPPVQHQAHSDEYFSDNSEDQNTASRQHAALPHTRPEFGLSDKQIRALGLAGPRTNTPDPASLSSRNYLRGEKFEQGQLGFSTLGMAGARGSTGRSYTGTRAAYGEYRTPPEGRPVFFPESQRYGSPPDLPSLLLQQRVIYISMPFVSSVTELVVAQCYYLDLDDRNRGKPIYVYLNSTGCINDEGQAIAGEHEFYAMWASLGFTRAPLYTGVTWKAQNQAAVLLAAGQKGHRYTFPHAKISTAPPVVNRVYGHTVDAQIQANELIYATKYYAAILARATGKPLEQCQKEYLYRKRYFNVREAYEEGLVDKLVPGYSLNRFRKMRQELLGEEEDVFSLSKPTFKFKRESGGSNA